MQASGHKGDAPRCKIANFVWVFLIGIAPEIANIGDLFDLDI